MSNAAEQSKVNKIPYKIEKGLGFLPAPVRNSLQGPKIPAEKLSCLN